MLPSMQDSLQTPQRYIKFKPCLILSLIKSILFLTLISFFVLFEGSPRIVGDEENNGPDDSDDELNIKNRPDASSIHQNFAYGSVLSDFSRIFFLFLCSLSFSFGIKNLIMFLVSQENGDYNSKQQWRSNGRAFSSTGSGIHTYLYVFMRVLCFHIDV